MDSLKDLQVALASLSTPRQEKDWTGGDFVSSYLEADRGRSRPLVGEDSPGTASGCRLATSHSWK